MSDDQKIFAWLETKVVQAEQKLAACGAKELADKARAKRPDTPRTGMGGGVDRTPHAPTPPPCGKEQEEVSRLKDQLARARRGENLRETYGGGPGSNVGRNDHTKAPGGAGVDIRGPRAVAPFPTPRPDEWTAAPPLEEREKNAAWQESAEQWEANRMMWEQLWEEIRNHEPE